jgi:hypothetical protein
MTLLALTLTSCVTGVIDETAQQPCGDPLRGSRYSLCGGLSSASIDATVNGKRLVGAVSSSHGPIQSSRYSLRGGTFHALR